MHKSEDFDRRRKDKVPFPDVVVIHGDSDPWPRTDEYKVAMSRLLKFLRRHVGFVVVISVGLFTADGEVMSAWKSEDQLALDKAIEMQQWAVSKENVVHINFRAMMKARMEELAKSNIRGENEAHMIGKTKKWKVQIPHGIYLFFSA